MNPARIFSILIGLGILIVSSAAADVPDPGYCSVSPCDALNGMIVCPDEPVPNSCAYITVSVRNGNDAPVAGAIVVVDFDQACDIAVCPDGVFTATTDANGIAEMYMAAGGCCYGVPGAGTIRANGVTIRAYDNVKGPDYNGGGPDLVVALGDLVQFANEFLASQPSLCHDYDNNGNTGLEDLICFAEAFLIGAYCP